MSSTNQIGAGNALCPLTFPGYRLPLAQLVLLIPETTRSLGRCSYQLYAMSHRLAHDWRTQCHSEGVPSHSMAPPPMLRSQRPWMQLLESLWPSCCPLCFGNPLAVTLWHDGDRTAQGMSDVCVMCWHRYTLGRTKRALIAISGRSTLGHLLGLEPVIESIAAFVAVEGSRRMRRHGMALVVASLYDHCLGCLETVS